MCQFLSWEKKSESIERKFLRFSFMRETDTKKLSNFAQKNCMSVSLVRKKIWENWEKVFFTKSQPRTVVELMLGCVAAAVTQTLESISLDLASVASSMASPVASSLAWGSFSASFLIWFSVLSEIVCLGVFLLSFLLRLFSCERKEQLFPGLSKHSFF